MNDTTPTEIEVIHGPRDDEGDPQPEPDAQPDSTEATPTDDAGEDDDRGDSRASRMRKRAQAAEAERDALRTQLTAARRSAAENACGLYQPAALWAAGVDVDTLYDDDGRLDPARLKEAAAHARATLGLATAPRPDPSQGPSGFHDSDDNGSWGEAFKSRHG